MAGGTDARPSPNTSLQGIHLLLKKGLKPSSKRVSFPISYSHPKTTARICTRKSTGIVFTFQNNLNLPRRCFGGFAMSATYGIPIRPTGDPWVRMVEESFTIGTGLGQPGKYLVDILPWLKYVPSWMPGAKFKRDAIEWRAVLKNSMIEPFEAATQAMVRCGSIPL